MSTKSSFVAYHLQYESQCPFVSNSLLFSFFIYSVITVNSSSSFDLSNGIIEKSFGEYETSSEEIIQNDPTLYKISEIKNPVEKTVNQLAQLYVDANLSLSAIKKIIPVINETTDGSIGVPEDKRFFQNNIKKSFEAKIYVKCAKCNEISEVGKCGKCGVDNKKGKDNFFIYLPIEQQIKKSLIEHFDVIDEYSNRQHNAKVYTDCDDSEIQKRIIDKNPNKKVLSLTLNIDGGLIADKSTHSLWPVQLYQNYIPPEIRFLPENILVAGLYYGDHKPDPYELLYPLLSELRLLIVDSAVLQLRLTSTCNITKFQASHWCKCLSGMSSSW